MTDSVLTGNEANKDAQDNTMRDNRGRKDIFIRFDLLLPLKQNELTLTSMINIQNKTNQNKQLDKIFSKIKQNNGNMGTW